MKDIQIEKLLQDLTEGCISSQNLAELESELISNPESMSRYLACQDLDNLLRIRSEVCSQQPASVVPVELILHRQKRKGLRLAVFSAAALLMFTFVVMRLFFVAPVEPTLSFQISPNTQFKLKHSSSEAQKGMTLKKGSRLQLSQGSVELTFESGVKAIVMAPADMTLDDHNKLDLSQGSAWFQVPEGAEGFQVTTDDLDIIDLGTEFGVIATPDGHDEVHVLKGIVQAAALWVKKKPVTLSAGEARQIDSAGLLIDIPVKSSAFLTKLPETLPHLHWSFDTKDGFQVKGSHPAAADINTVGHASTELVLGKFGEALDLGGHGQYLMTDWFGFDGSRPRTVCLWIKIPAEDYNVDSTAILGWGDNSIKGGKWEMTVSSNRRKSTATLALGFAKNMIKISPQIELGEWHHVAVSYSGRPDSQGLYTPEFYIDGQAAQLMADAEQMSDTIDTVTDSRSSQPLSIGAILQANKKLIHKHYLKGQIDELYIFDGYMTERQIQQLSHP